MNDGVFERFAAIGGEPGQATSLQPTPAGFWIRVGAALLDAVFGLIIAFIFGFALSIGHLHTFAPEAPGNDPVMSIFQLVFFIVYYVIPESSAKMQGSLGKYIIGIKIIKEDGNKMSFLRALGRNLAKIISSLLLMIGYIMVGIRKDKRGLHDLIASTYVVYR